MLLTDAIYLHGLNLLPQLGPARLSVLAAGFKNFKEAYEASQSSLVSAGIDSEIAQAYVRLREQINLHHEAEKLNEQQINILTFRDNAYPKLLLEIPKFPPILYYRGVMDEPDELCLAAVGTRQITSYGRMVTFNLLEPLVDAGATIVSGMAFGVDAACHEVAVTKGRRTIAVLGGGLDEQSLYPKHHGLLAKNILDAGGALISEYPIGTPNFKQNFIARNRLISGLSVATLIIECGLESGTLITAKHALDQNRQVYAVPGPIYSSQSQGPNNLIKMGARAVTSAEDIFQDLNLDVQIKRQEAKTLFTESQEESAILKLLGHTPMLVNELIKQTGIKPAQITSALTFLEMKGRVKNVGGQQYVRSK